MSHPRTIATVKLIKSRYFWPDTNKNINSWTKEGLTCEQVSSSFNLATFYASWNSVYRYCRPITISHYKTYSSPVIHNVNWKVNQMDWNQTYDIYFSYYSGYVHFKFMSISFWSSLLWLLMFFHDFNLKVIGASVYWEWKGIRRL